MERDSFVFYRSFYEAIDCLEDSEALDCLRAVARYALDGIEPSITGAAKAVFISVKPQIDANNRRYLNGCKGGKPKANQDVTKNKPNNNLAITKTVPNENVNENENENVNVNDNENEKSKTKTPAFCPPSLDEVKDYCWERKNKVDAQAFIDFYTSKGWMIGKTKMKDWKAAVRTWERRDTDKVTPIRDNKSEVDDFFRRELGV